MELALRQAYGLWGHLGGLGESYDYGGEYGSVVSSDPIPYAGPSGYYGDLLTEDQIAAYVPASDAQIAADYAAVLASGKAGGYEVDTGTAAGKLALANAVTAFAKLGMKAIAPNPTTGACPAGTTRNGPLCVSPSPGGAPLIPGISNQALMIGGVVLFALIMLGKKR